MAIRKIPPVRRARRPGPLERPLGSIGPVANPKSYTVHTLGRVATGPERQRLRTLARLLNRIGVPATDEYHGIQLNWHRVPDQTTVRFVELVEDLERLDASGLMQQLRMLDDLVDQWGTPLRESARRRALDIESLKLEMTR